MTRLLIDYRERATLKQRELAEKLGRYPGDIQFLHFCGSTKFHLFAAHASLEDILASKEHRHRFILKDKMEIYG